MSEPEPPHPELPHLVILGLMGVGKSTTGTALAAELGCAFVDSDADVQRLTGKTGAQYAAEHDVAALHRLEGAVLIGALARADRSVIAAAASTVEDPIAFQIMRRAGVVRLDLSLQETRERQAAGDHRRPMPVDELQAISTRREPLFVEVEDLRLDARRTTEDLVREIITFFDIAFFRH